MTPFEVLNLIKQRTAEAVVAQSGLSHEGLRQYLRTMLSGDDPRSGSLLQEPVVEGAHPFVSADITMDQTSASLLHQDLVNILDGLPEGHDYRFPRNRRPFRHQLEAWQNLLTKDPKSVLITSGTGSGKTECFLFPILSDLASQVHGKTQMLKGVQAIMLYPLNALIESQRERLSAWMTPFKGKLRYCLYNGDLPKTEAASARRSRPEQVIDREELRDNAPPLLVTNVTMLEYMLVRAEDNPILGASKGKLKWIVLDEAHSLVGAAAAEIALLLRRVMLAFDVRPQDVRFVATSATIGSGENLRRQLQRFLADVAGISDEHVVVVEGARQLPNRPQPGPSPAVAIADATPSQLYDILGRDPASWSYVERLHQGGVGLSAFASAAGQFGTDAAGLVHALSRAARKNDNGEEERLTPVRLHAFERAVPGLWSCVNADCSGRADNWKFGHILPERADDCPCCRAPVLEIVSCSFCSETYLAGQEHRSRLSAPLRNPPRDEFADDSARDSDGDTVAQEGDDERKPDEVVAFELKLERLFAVTPTASARPYWLDRKDGWKVAEAPAEGGLTLWSDDPLPRAVCPHCQARGTVAGAQLRPLRFGAPFIVGNAAPILLEGVSPAKTKPSERLPAAGRRLLSFTDSRQGTARMAAKLQTEAERNFVRSFIYHQVQASMRPAHGSAEEAKSLADDIKKLESAGVPALADMIDRKKAKLTRLLSGNSDGIPWPELVRRLSERIEVSEWIKPVWSARDEELFSSAARVAEFLLLREFDRRPRSSMSIETLGFAKIRNPATDRLTDVQVPTSFIRRGRNALDWRTYLDAVLTHFVRNNRFSEIDRRLLHWISHKAVRRSLVGPDREANDRMKRGWPNGYRRAYPQSRPVALLLMGLNLNLDNASDRSDLDECLQSAWHQTQTTFSADPEQSVYDFSKTYVAPVVDGFFCPVTRRLLDAAPFGLTPYGLREKEDTRRRAVPLIMPRHPNPLLGNSDPTKDRIQLYEWVKTDTIISDLRARGAWNNISDRIALFADYARSAEHSAQQDSQRLRRYEAEFKAGQINILNCSTTMEMGVDIGTVSSVMMTNVPPSITNYRQRVGRAGRRGQSIALAFTFCKDRPLDREAFRDPAAFLQRSLSAPKVTLTSRPIVQRHVNAFLLSQFMHQQSGNAMKMQIGAFLGCPGDIDTSRPLSPDRPVEGFISWLEKPSTREELQDSIAKLTLRTILESDRMLIFETRDAIRALADQFSAEWEGLRALARDEGRPQSGIARMTVELRRLCGEFLLSSLADRAFLPGHGFPTDVVSFVPGKQFRTLDNLPDGARQSRSAGPQRSLDLAIRDYAPGSEVVLDGLVYQSAGVTLNWKRPASEECINEIQSIRSHWQCEECGASGTRGAGESGPCPACGAPQLVTEEYLRPAGFSVDPREQAHAETDTLDYVPPKDPDVSTRDAVWCNLPIPERGRYRMSREGSVYYSNKGGPGGFGYAICLECGRAEANYDNRGTATPKPVLKDHKPLRFRRGQDICPGNHKPFAIKRNLALGFEVTTDVIELQPRASLRQAAANALAIALREALAQELGIEADEMGFAVAKRRNALGGDSASLFLFDRPTGGGGFATSFESLMRPVLERAERILDCRTPCCERACAACVLTADAPSGKDELDRTAALDFLRTHLMLPVDLPEKERFSASAQLSLAPIDEIDRQLRQTTGSGLTIFVSEHCKLTGLQDWPLANQFITWSLRGHVVSLALSPAQINALTPAEKIAFRDFAMRHHASLHAAATPIVGNGAGVIAAVTNSTPSSYVWASRDAAVALPGQSWGRPETSPIARGPSCLTMTTSPIDLDSLLPPPGAEFLEIGTEFDVSLSKFGETVAKRLVEALKKCGAWPRGGIAALSYRDPYVTSPLVSRLLIDTVAHIVSRSASPDASIAIHTLQPRINQKGFGPSKLWEDWENAQDQKAVVEQLGQQKGLALSLTHGEVPHGRFMDITFKDGSNAMIVLDQGFGAWGIPRGRMVRYDFAPAPQAQARWLASFDIALQRRGAGRSYIVVSAK